MSGISIVTSDLDGDQDQDLAVTHYGGFSILKNNGDGTFSANVDYEVSDEPSSIFLSDLDVDGDKDVIITNFGELCGFDFCPDSTVSVLMNQGTEP